MPHHKTLHLELKASKKKRTIAGYASIFGVLDHDGDVVMPGAFTETLKERGLRIPLLWQHDPREPIGRPTVLHEDDKGLYFEDKIAGTRRGDEALTLVDEGVIDGVSIGYEILKRGEVPEGNGLAQLDLFEHSLVTFPANDFARTLGVKDAWSRLPSGLYAKQETISALAMSTSLDKGPASVASALSLILDAADGNRSELLVKMADALGTDVDGVYAILAGEPVCPTVATLDTIAETLAIDVKVLLAAGNRGGCEYEMSSDVEPAEDAASSSDVDEKSDDVDEKSDDVDELLTDTEAEIKAVRDTLQRFSSSLDRRETRERRQRLFSRLDDVAR